MSDDLHDDLGAVLGQLLGVLLEREAPILEAHGLTMWEYVILYQLQGERGLTQKELARRSHRDPTRLIGHLDVLSDRRLIAREVDAADRRRHTVRLTDEGLDVVRATRRDIRAMEAELLGVLSIGEQKDLRNSLAAVLQQSGSPRRSSDDAESR
jgi:DNA-binding MarR family transcriptional regulator